MADQGAAILVIVMGNTNFMINKIYRLKSSCVIEIDHTRHLKHLGTLSGQHFAQTLHIGRLTLWRKAGEKSNQLKVVET